MKSNFTSAPKPPVKLPMQRGLTLLLATACGLIAANIYYSQPLVGPIGAALKLSPNVTGLIVTMTQIGYGGGLLLIVPLADLFENRRLVLIVLVLATVSLVGAALSTQAFSFFVAALLIGIGSVAVQILVPYAAHLAPEEVRGKAVGNVMSGLLLGIMLARPVASLFADVWSWRAVFFFSAGVMVILLIVLSRALPIRQPSAGLGYGDLLASMGQLAFRSRVLQRRSIYQAFMFGAFSLFWTTVPLLLASPVFRLTQAGIALFTLAGVAGAIAAPIAGRVADKGWSRSATAFAMCVGGAAFLITRIGVPGSNIDLALLVTAAILLDFAVSTNVVLGQRAIYALRPELRSRLNGIYMATFFAGGAIGSALGVWTYARGGWTAVSWVGFTLPFLAFVFFLTERKETKPSMVQD